MPEITDAEAGQVDLALAAYLEEGEWYVQELAPGAADSVETIARELRRYPGETGALALVSVDEDFLLVVRSTGGQVRVLLSDASAATDWPLARSAVDHLGLHVEDDDEEVPAGDLAIVADMGMPAADLGALLDDLDLYPDEILSELAARLGFGDRFDELAGLAE
ncbi:tRNA adenosine deaminase-associated protein [Nocardioides terrisoli]|uniref:tRNA adenosine deaminase-associated protein n=1 Tax=Nocardioides terrisoli TaxID=3388267 RepID=UPI00287B5C61|nr:tRNA adenosine deaminase-associated protein [Nocardioides marmorisolisilvae]